MPTLQEAIDVLAISPRDEAVKLLHEKAQAIWQGIFDKGHGVATDASKIKYDLLLGEKTTLEGKFEAMDKKVKELENKSPDLAKIHSEHAEEIRKINEAHTSEVNTLKATNTKSRLSVTVSGLKEKLTKAGIVGRYADTLLADPKLMERLQLREDGSVIVLQKGKSIELIAAEGKSSLDLLADELFQETKTSDPDMIRVVGDAGSGVQNGNGGAGAATGGDTYAKIRESVKKDEEARGPTTGEATLDKRFNLPTPA